MGFADQIYFGGNILTMDASMLNVQALAIKDGRILAAGKDQEVMNLVGPGTKTTNLYGRFVMPGLVESHTHALWGACRDLFDVYVGYNATFEMLTDAVRARSEHLEPGDVIYGGPWRLDMRNAMGNDPKAILDNISTTSPIILVDTSQHILWCNSKALELAGLVPGVADIPGGVIERTSNGAPNGILAESAGVSVRALMTRSQSQLAEASREFTRYFNSLGITAFKEPMAYEEDLKAYLEADQRGDLSLHMAAHIVRQSPMSVEPIPFETMDRLRWEYASTNIRTNFAKLFLDGVAPGHTASFFEPYIAFSGYDVDAHDPNATLLMDPKLLNETVIELDNRGYVIKMHAVGDNAIRKGLDAIEAARITNGPSGLRHEIAHSVFVSDQDLGRFDQLDAIAEMSPKLWFPNAATSAQIAVLGESRLQKAHRIGDLLAAGAEMTYASDWPASAPDANPWVGLSGMLTRRNCNPDFSGTLAKDQAISLVEALPLFTTNGARSLGMGNETGSLSAGKWADFIILNESLFEMDAIEIGNTRVQQTVWKGNVVHSL
ncbi:MAG: amidohydrolase [Amylibacter sp.]|nr:amidohydrolase [Amylibacter sp.]